MSSNWQLTKSSLTPWVSLLNKGQVSFQERIQGLIFYKAEKNIQSEILLIIDLMLSNVGLWYDWFIQSVFDKVHDQCISNG